MARPKSSKLASTVLRNRDCAAGVCNPQRKQGLKAPAAKGEHELVNIRGPGVFVAAQISKQGGSTGLTFASLEIDGKNVTSLSFAAAENWGLTQSNPYGIVLLRGAQISTLTVGFPTPLRFERVLRLTVKVQEAGVVQIIGNVIQGSA
jgi:hypothetical protein